MTEEFDLSKKECNILITKVEIDKINEITKMPLSYFSFERGFFKEDVKEFIRLLKEEFEEAIRFGNGMADEAYQRGFNSACKCFLGEINKLAGEK